MEQGQPDLMGARDVGMTPKQLAEELHSHLKSSGILGSVKGQLRAQMLSQLKKGNMVKLAPPPGDQPTLKRKALNSMIAEYLGAASYQYSLSVFSEEANVSVLSRLSEEELVDVLRIERGSPLFHAMRAAKQAVASSGNAQGACFLLHLIEALADVGQVQHAETSKPGPTAGYGDRYHLEMKLQQLEDEYAAKLRAERMRPGQGVEERMAIYRQEIEDQARAEVARQVERIREVEVAAARLDESTRWRKAIESERAELERIHADRLAKLRAREEEMSDKLKRQQREVEAVAFEHRQRILREEERLRTWRAEAQSALDSREEQLKHVERAMELREKAVMTRESAAERKAAEAAEVASSAHLVARAEVEKEYLELKANLNAQRLQLEMDRARVSELRTEAAGEVAAARAKEDRVRALEAARAEAEARAAAHAAEAEVVRLQVERLQFELATVRDELARRVAAAAESADAMLTNAAGALGMLESEAHQARGAVAQLRVVEQELQALQQALQEEGKARAAAEQERDKAKDQAAAVNAQAQSLAYRLKQMEALIEEALEAREDSLRQAESAQFTVSQLQRELADTKAALRQAREEAIVLRVQGYSGGSTGMMGTPVSAAGLLSRGGHGAAQTWVATGAAGVGTAGGGGILSSRGGMGLSIDVPQPGGLSPRGGHPGSSQLQSALLMGRGASGSMSPRGSTGFLPGTLAQAWLPGSTALPRPATGAPGANAAPPPSVAASKPSSGAPSLAAAKQAAAEQGRPKSPVYDRMEELSRAEREQAGEMSSFRRRVAEQREASARELSLVMQRVQQSATTSKRASATGEEDGEGALRRSASNLRSSMTTGIGGYLSTGPPSPPGELVIPMAVPLPSALQPPAALPTIAAASAMLSSMQAAGGPHYHHGGLHAQGSISSYPSGLASEAGYPDVEHASSHLQGHASGTWPPPPSQQHPASQPPLSTGLHGPAGAQLREAWVPGGASISLSDFPSHAPQQRSPVSHAPPAAAAAPVGHPLQPAQQPLAPPAPVQPAQPAAVQPPPGLILAHDNESLGRASSTGMGQQPPKPSPAVPATLLASNLPTDSRSSSLGGVGSSGPGFASSGPSLAGGVPPSSSGAALAGLATPPPPAPAPAPAPAPISAAPVGIPGLVIVQDLSIAASARSSVTGAAAREEGGSGGGGTTYSSARVSIGGPGAGSGGGAQQEQEAARVYVSQPSIQDVKSAQAAKLKLLQEQQEARLAAQRQQQEEEERRRRAEEEAAASRRAAQAQEEEEEVYEDDFGSPSGSAASAASGTGGAPTSLPSVIPGARSSAAGSDGSSSLHTLEAPGSLQRAGLHRLGGLEEEEDSVGSSGGHGAGLETPDAGDERDGHGHGAHHAHGGHDDYDDDDDLPSEMGDLEISVGEDSGLVVGDADSDGGLGNLLGAEGSEGSVF